MRRLAKASATPILFSEMECSLRRCDEESTPDLGEKKDKEAPLARGAWGQELETVNEHRLGGLGGTTKLRKRAIGCEPLTLKKRRTPCARPLMHTVRPKP